MFDHRLVAACVGCATSCSERCARQDNRLVGIEQGPLGSLVNLQVLALAGNPIEGLEGLVTTTHDTPAASTAV